MYNLAIPTPTQEYMQKYMPPPNSRLSIFSTILIPCLLVLFFSQRLAAVATSRTPNSGTALVYTCVYLSLFLGSPSLRRAWERRNTRGRVQGEVLLVPLISCSNEATLDPGERRGGARLLLGTVCNSHRNSNELTSGLLSRVYSLQSLS